MVRSTVVRSTMGPSIVWALLCPFIMGSTMGSTISPTMGSTMASTTIVEGYHGWALRKPLFAAFLVGCFMSSIMGSMVCSLPFQISSVMDWERRFE